MRLTDLLSGLLGELEHSYRPLCDGRDITGVTADSRRTKPGYLFVALHGDGHGLRKDGHAFAQQAVQNGAAAILAERPLPELSALAPQVPVLVVPATAPLFGRIVARFAGAPAKRLTSVGITGTNGKTTTSFLVESILRAAGHRPGLIGTVRTGIGTSWAPSHLTTPGPVELQEWLGRMVADHATHVVMEVSSIALDQHRTAGIEFSVGAFTNLTRDHLDYHPSMEAYFEAKARLFSDGLDENGTAVVCIDTDVGRRLCERVAGRMLRCASQPQPGTSADVAVASAAFSASGIVATLDTPAGRLEIESPLLAQHNLQNLVVAVGVALALGVAPAHITAGIAALAGVPGRLERVPAPDRLVLVDYAHTPDALERALQAVRPLVAGRLWLVFGCGGDRDPGKRPLMGRIGAGLADRTIVTSDNPRTEDPLHIISQIMAGVPAERRMAVEAEPDRAAAIHRAISMMAKSDALVIAGKGHEDYQIIGQQKRPFDDRICAAHALAERA